MTRPTPIEALVHKGTLTREECAVYLGVDPTTVDMWTSNHGLPVMQLGTRARKHYSKRLVDQWVEENSTTNPRNIIPLKTGKSPKKMKGLAAADI